MTDTRKNTKKMTKRTFAISAAEPAIPVNPKTPAINATIKNIKAQFSINSVGRAVIREGPDTRHLPQINLPARWSIRFLQCALRAKTEAGPEVPAFRDF